MPSNYIFALTLLIGSAFVVESFSPLVHRRGSRIPTTTHTTTSSTTTLQFSSLSTESPDEMTYRYCFAKARECAFNDDASPSEARQWLNMILELESGCVVGTLAGHELCDNVDEVAEVVANLRERANQDDSIATAR